MRSTYQIAVENPDHVMSGVASADLDGVPVDAEAIPLVDDGGTHRLSVVMGRGERSRPGRRTGTSTP
jgi:hypothetical protein